MVEKKYLVEGVSKEELLAGFEKKGVEIIGDRDYRISYLKHTQDDEDLKSVVYYENNYLDFDPDFPEDPKIQVLVGDPRNKHKFETVNGTYGDAIQKLEACGYEEFSCSVSKDLDLVMPEDMILSGSSSIIGVSSYVIGDPNDKENYEDTIEKLVITERVVTDKIYSGGKEIQVARAGRMERFLKNFVSSNLSVAEIEGEINTALDLVGLTTKNNESVSGEDE